MGVVILERKHGDGGSSWQVRWNRRRNDRPRAVYLGCWPERKYAERWRERALHILAETGTVSREALGVAPVSAAPSTLGSIAAKWLDSQHVGAKAKAANVRHARIIAERWPTKAPHQLTRQDVQGWIDDMVNDGHSRGTIINHLNTLRPMLRHVDVDPVWLRGIRGFSIPHEDWVARDLPSREVREAVRALLSEACQEVFDICEHGGLRTSEAVALVRRQVRPDGLRYIGTKYVRKGGKPPRSVPLLPVLTDVDWIAPLLVRLGEGGGPDDRVFDMSDRHFQEAVAKACETAGVEKFIPYDLRHLHATRLLGRCLSVMTVHDMAKRLGHAQDVFIKTYSDHELPEGE